VHPVVLEDNTSPGLEVDGNESSNHEIAPKVSPPDPDLPGLRDEGLGKNNSQHDPAASSKTATGKGCLHFQNVPLCLHFPFIGWCSTTQAGFFSPDVSQTAFVE
jgi:hypothetical protein